MNELVILGCGSVNKDINGREVWTLARNPYKLAERYYDFHDIQYPQFPYRTILREVLEKVKEIPCPKRNSIQLMLLEALVEGYTDIELIGTPLLSEKEYIYERMGLAYCICYGREHFKANIKWDQLDQDFNILYAKTRFVHE